MNKLTASFLVAGFCVTVALACVGGARPTSVPSVVLTNRRESKIPANAVKMSPETDEAPPIVHLDEFKSPIPVPGKINTAGAEDSPFVTEDGETLYFFFTPDVNVPVEKQILDGVTGIYVSRWINGEWDEPERVILQDAGKLSLDGCEFVLHNMMWFCSVREGYSGVHWFTAEYKDGQWRSWKIAEFPPEYGVGELHITGDGRELYFASDRPGGRGALDIWVSERAGEVWQEPSNVTAVNTADNEGWPAISPNGDELWFARNNGIWRSKRIDGTWQEPELVVSPLAGEPSVDSFGNLYFVHHYYSGGEMIEADLYVAYRR